MYFRFGRSDDMVLLNDGSAVDQNHPLEADEWSGRENSPVHVSTGANLRGTARTVQTEEVVLVKSERRLSSYPKLATAEP
ncbi:hypothetical protein ASD12_18595 [Mesorhizobium sp. Root102]|nr:hypothetical protein ASD12_18595 [Mesorhizobium sp. Root102]